MEEQTSPLTSRQTGTVQFDMTVVDAQACPHTDLEHQAVVERAQLGAPQVKRSERHPMFVLSRLLTRAQATWLEKHAGTLFDRYSIEDGFEVEREAVREAARENKKVASHE